MTSPLDEQPPITAPGIHDHKAQQLQAPFTQRQMRAYGDALTNQILSKVLYAVSGVNVFGIQPFAFLAQWAEALQQRANDAYATASGAQSSANYANAQLLGLTNAGLASDVPGGVSIVEPFNGAEADNLGSSFTRRSTEPGGGQFGPDGNGSAVWKRSGGITRIYWDRHNIPLATRHQAVVVVMSTKVEAPLVGGVSWTMLQARVSADDLTFVYARLNHNQLEVGCYVSNTPTVFHTEDVDWKDGDVVHLLVGTDVDDREFIVKRNGLVLWRGEDTANVSQVDDTNYLYVGITSCAADRGFQSGPFNFYNNSQTMPAGLDIFSAADRLPNSI